MAGDQRRMAPGGTPLPELPPHSIETEQEVLGAILLNNELYGKVVGLTETGHFYEELHQAIWEIIAELLNSEMAATPKIVATYLDEVKMPGDVTVLQYLARLVTECSTPREILSHAKVLRDMWVRRQLIEMMQEVEASAYTFDAAQPIAQLLDRMEGALEGLRSNGHDSAGYVSLDRVADQARAAYDQTRERGHHIAGISTGFDRLDAQLSGLEPANMYVIAGRPGSGKTVLGGNIAKGAARDIMRRERQGERLGVVGFISAEMSQVHIVNRLLSDEANIPHHVLHRSIEMEEDQRADYEDAMRRLAVLPLEIDASRRLTMPQIKSKARKLKRKKGLACLVVDYLQMLTWHGRDNTPEHERVAYYSHELKELAKELHIPVVVLSQVSRDVDKRDDKRPSLADLRGSGNIEQDADAIAFIYREEYYLRKQEPRPGGDDHLNWQRKLWAAAGVAEVTVAKNRHGSEIMLEMGFEGRFMRFTDEAPERGEPPQGGPISRAGPMRIPAKATIALGELRTLSMAFPKAEGLERVPRGVRAVPYDVWKEHVLAQIGDPDASPAKKAEIMSSICASLKAPGSGHNALIGRGGTKEAAYVWLTEAG